MRFEKEINQLASDLVPYLEKAKESCAIEVSYRYLNDTAPTYRAYCEYVWINGKLPDYPPYNRFDSKFWIYEYGHGARPLSDNKTPEEAAETIAWTAFDERSRRPEEDEEYPIAAVLDISIDGKDETSIDC